MGPFQHGGLKVLDRALVKHYPDHALWPRRHTCFLGSDPEEVAELTARRPML